PLQIIIQDSNIKFNSQLSKVAAKHIENKDEIRECFDQFYLHHESKGTLMSDWSKGFELWCSRWESFKPKQATKSSQEKADYKWEFKKLQQTSDSIKDKLRFVLNINWIEEYYMKDKPIVLDNGNQIRWVDMMHPDFNKKEIILYKVGSSEENILSLPEIEENIIDIEVIQ
ncbi:MAG: hypothetical protein U9Q04_05130, partial [Campylobacterota bacterium]|nr:hypothetical protein [Campylobacterota bacterium]